MTTGCAPSSQCCAQPATSSAGEGRLGRVGEGGREAYFPCPKRPAPNLLLLPFPPSCSFPDSPEDVLMLSAINDVNLPKFLDQV